MTDRDMDHEKRVAVTQRALEQIPDLYASLHLFLVRGSTGEGTIGGPSGSRPPMDLGVIDLMDMRQKPDADPNRLDAAIDHAAGARRQGVIPTLASWVRLVDGELWDEGTEHKPPADSPTVSSESSFLLRHIEWIGQQQWFDEFDKDVGKIRSDVRTVIRDRDVTEHLMCTDPDCQWNVVPMDKGTWFRCTGCERSWGRVELHKMAERKRPRPLKECAAIAGTSVRTLRRAIERGDLRHVAADGAKRLFDVQDVVVAAAKAKISA